MKISSAIAAAGLVTAMMMFGSTDSIGQETCDHGGNHTIEVRPAEAGMPSLSYRGGSAEEVPVCSGDTVKWILIGPNRKFFVDFFTGDGAPFAGATKRGSDGNVVLVQIDAEPKSGAYEYGVKFDNGPEMDPRIVVD